jgi:uncharacterized protein (DUF58 family)
VSPLRYGLVLAVIALLALVEIVAALALLLVFLAIYVRRMPAAALAQVEITRQHPTRLFNGETADVVTVAANRGRWPLPWLSIYESIPMDLSVETTRWVTTLAPGEERTVTYRVKGRRRGYYRLGPSVLTTSDVLWWRPAQRTLASHSAMVVYPRIVTLEKLGLPALAPIPELATRIPLFEDQHRIVGVRDYASGDPMRRIHWSASAASGSLLVKRLQPGIGRETIVLLDLHRGSYPGRARRSGIELAVTAAASVLYHVVTTERLPAGLSTVAHDPIEGKTITVDLTPRADSTHLIEMLEVLARVGATEVDSLWKRTVTLPFGSTVVVVTGGLDQMKIAALLGMRRAGMAVAVILVRTDQPSGWEGLRREGIKIWPVEAERSLILN